MTLSVANTYTGSDDDGTLTISSVTAAIGTMAVVLIASDNNGASGAAPTYTVTDSAGNTYTQRGTTGNRTSGSSNDGASQFMFTAPINTALSSGSITATRGSGTPDLAVIVYIVSSDAGVPVFSSAGTPVTGFRSTHECTASINVVSGQMIIGHAAIEMNATFVVPTGDSDTVNGNWSSLTRVSRANLFEADATCMTSAAQHKVVSATGNQTWSITTPASYDSAANYLILDESSALSADAGVFSITGTAANLQPTLKIIAAGSASYTIDGIAADTEFGREVVGDAASFLVSGTAATVEKAYPLTAEAGVIAINGADAAVLYGAGDRLPTVAGSFVVSGAAATLQHDFVSQADVAFYFVDGVPADLEITKEVAAAAGSFSISGTAADLERGRVFTATAGSFVITGAGATLNRLGALQVIADGAAFSVTGAAATLTAPAPVSPPTEITAQAPSFAYWRKSKERKQKSPTLPPPMKAEVRIDPAVLAQAEADRRAAEMKQKRIEAAARVSANREKFPPRARVLR
jgi:hypothetical protein